MTAQSTYNEEMDIGFAGMVSDSSEIKALGMRSDAASNSIRFGYAVKRASVSDKKSADEPTTINDVIAGIVIHTHTLDSTQLDAVGVLPGNKLSVLRRGRILVACEDGCDVGDRLHIRVISGGAGEYLGALLAAADGVNTIDSEGQGEWQSQAAAGGFAWLEVDFLNTPA